MSDTKFYDTSAWRRVRKETLKRHNNECQFCLERHVHTRAVIVHHVFHLDQYPQFGLLAYVKDPVTGTQIKNLMPVCKDCHETVCHPERLRKMMPYKPPLTTERW